MMTSAMAAKELKKLNERHEALLGMERKYSEFVAAIQEDIETVRPEYDFQAVQKEFLEIEARIRVLKHAINRFNQSQTVPGFDMTIDEMLVFIPQLTKRKAKLITMNSKLPKERVGEILGRSANIIDYVYLNYDLDKVASDLDVVTDELSRAQLALDIINNSRHIEIDL